MRIEPPRRAPDNEQKLIVLYCLSQFGPCTELQLLQFLFGNDLMNYFDMMIALSDLCARGQAVRTKKRAGYLYQPTEAGLEALGLFGGRIPASVQSLVSENAPALRERFRQELHSQQQIRQTQRGEYEVSLTAMEQDMDLMRLELTLPTRELASQLAEKWPRKAAEVYETVFRILTEEAQTPCGFVPRESLAAEEPDSMRKAPGAEGHAGDKL